MQRTLYSCRHTGAGGLETHPRSYLGSYPLLGLFSFEMEQKLRVQSKETMRIHKKRLAQTEKRIGEINRLFIRIYEDNVAGGSMTISLL